MRLHVRRQVRITVAILFEFTIILPQRPVERGTVGPEQTMLELVRLLIEQDVSVLSLLGGNAQIFSNKFDAIVVILVPLPIMLDYGIVMTTETRIALVDDHGVEFVDVTILVLEVFDCDAKSLLMGREPRLVKPKLVLKVEWILQFRRIVGKPFHMNNQHLGQQFEFGVNLSL